MNYSVFVRVWGALDIAYVAWRVVSDISESKIPFIGNIMESYEVGGEFGIFSLQVLALIASLLILSMILSGPLMLFLRKAGVYISLVQFPFRIVLAVPPTFFFLQSLNEAIPSVVLIGAILMLEVVKAVTEILWLRARR